MQSPHWSLAPFGFQRQRTSPRQRASPPAADAGTPQQQAAAKAAARVELGKYVEEIQPAGSPSPRLTPRYRSPRTSPRRGLCSTLCSGAARWVAGRRGGSLASALLAAVVLALLLWGGRQLAEQRRDELQQWMSYVPAVHPSVAFGAARQAAPSQQHPPQRCQLQLDGSPWERHCQRLRRVCVDQGSLILYEDRYQQMDGRRAGALPELLVDTSKVRGSSGSCSSAILRAWRVAAVLSYSSNPGLRAVCCCLQPCTGRHGPQHRLASLSLLIASLHPSWTAAVRVPLAQNQPAAAGLSPTGRLSRGDSKQQQRHDEQ